MFLTLNVTTSRACHRGDVEVARCLTNHGMYPYGGDGLNSAMHAASIVSCNKDKSQLEIAEVLLEHYPELLDQSGREGNEPLHCAAMAGNASIISMLLDCYKAVLFDSCSMGCDTELLSLSDHVAQYYYISVDDDDDALLHQPDINSQRYDLKTPLHLASQYGRYDAVKAMLEFSSGIARMLSATDVSDDVRSILSVHLMIEWGVTDCDGVTVLQQVTATGGDQMLDLVLQHAPRLTAPMPNDPSSSENSSCGLLTTAVQRGHLGVLKTLLKYDLCVDLAEAINKAVESRKEEMVILMLLKLVEREGPSSGEIKWQGQKLAYVKREWLLQAAEHLASTADVLVTDPPSSHPSSLSLVTFVDLSKNNLASVPVELFLMQKITSLNLACNELSMLFDPSVLAGTAETQLSEQGHLPPAPSQLGESRLKLILPCQQLRDLNVRDNKLTILPSELFQLQELQNLDVSVNNLEELPGNFWECRSLERVYLAKNSLRKLPEPHGSYMTGNVAPELTVSSASSRNLRLVKTQCEMDACSPHNASSCADVTQSPTILAESIERETVFHKDRFPSLSLVQDQSLSLPVKQHVKQCEVFSLASQYLYSNTSCKRMKKSRSVSDRRPMAYSYTLIADSEDETVSLSLFGSHHKGSSLTELYVSHNQLRSLPLGFPCLAPNLKKLDISFNKLEELDPVAMLPPSLCYLNASNNQVQTTRSRRRATCGCCAGTEERSLGPTLCRHQRHDSMHELHYFRLNNNQLADVEFVQVRKHDGDSFDTVVLYPKLSILELKQNRFTAFPENVDQLQKLHTLNVSYNAGIKKLPDNLIHLPNLEFLTLEGLDLIDFPQSLFDKGAKRIQNYLKHRLVGSHLYRRMKLMVVGQAEKGRTSLVQRLVLHGTPTRFSGSDPSEGVGIQVSEIVLRPNRRTARRCSNASPIKFSIWDFVSHDKYDNAHQCFLTRRCIYLVVWNLEDGLRGVEDLAALISNIQARAPGSPVLIVGTHLDKINKRSNASNYLDTIQRELECRYVSPDYRVPGRPIVDGHIEVALMNKVKNIDKLRNMIFEVASQMKGSTGKWKSVG